MLDANYFETILPDQVQAMEQPVRLTLHLTTGAEYLIHAVVAAHATYVVLKVHGEGKPHKHTPRWQQAHPKDEAVIFDQVCAPYAVIADAHLTARTTKGDDTRKLGFVS